MTDAERLSHQLDVAALRPTRLVLHLVGLLLAFTAVAPLFWMASMSFKGADEVFGVNLIPNHPTLGNFFYVFVQVDFLRYLWNTFFVAASVTIIALFFHSMAGYA